ncbi:MAG: PH domain-containing protein [Terracidiphilus sp.]
MGSYVRGTLTRDEHILYEGKISLWTQLPLILLGAFFLLWMIATIAADAAIEATPVEVVLFILGILPIVIAFLRYRTTELSITNKRIVAKFGLISRNSIEMKLAKVESVQVHQGIRGRIFNYGSLIVSGAGNPMAPVPGISNPLEFRRVAMEAQDQTGVATEHRSNGEIGSGSLSMESHSNRSIGNARAFGFFFLLLILVAVTVVLTHKARTPTSTQTATTEGPAQPASGHSASEPTQPTPGNSTAEPAPSDTMQPFTSTNGRFSVLFPTVPQQSTRPFQKNGKTATLYDFVATADYGNIGYIVGYSDFAPDAFDAASPQILLQGTESGFVAGKSLLSDQIIDLHGIPGRAYTAADSEYNYNVHDFLAGTRLYRLLVSTRKGYTAPKGDQFMNSFRIDAQQEQVNADPRAVLPLPTVDAAPATSEAKALTDCLVSSAQNGQYSSFDGGKSATKLLADCPDQWKEYIDACMRSGDADGNCTLKSAILAQTALKLLNK